MYACGGVSRLSFLAVGKSRDCRVLCSQVGRLIVLYQM